MPEPSSIRRRDVLRGGTFAAASMLGAPLLGTPLLGQPGPARPGLAKSGAGRAQDERVVRLGIVGLRGRGWNHYHGFRALPGVEVVALCDVDGEVLARRGREAAGDAAGEASS